jgi:hypothetical protein
MKDTALAAARQLLDSGFTFCPIKTKDKPTVKWGQYRKRQPTSQEVGEWFGNGSALGIALLCGRLPESKLNLEVLDIDSGDLIKPFEAAVKKAVPDLLDRLVRVQSPRDGGGRHYAFLYPGRSEPGQKLAVELRDGSIQTLIETRGANQYVVVPGSPPDVHPANRPYRYLKDSFRYSEIQEITASERQQLLEVARSFTRTVVADRDETSRGSVDLDTSRPGDDFNQNGPSWEELLTPYGWQIKEQVGPITYWVRPGKDPEQGHSATTGFVSEAGRELFIVFSSNAHPFTIPPGQTYATFDRFGTLARLQFGGDLALTALELAARAGYGTQDTSVMPVAETAETWKPVAPADADSAAYHGLMGELAQVYRGQTEAHPLAILVIGLCGAGNCIGRGPHFFVGCTRHFTIENTLVVGSSSFGRKGTAQDVVDDVFSRVDPEWVEYRKLTSLSSGEGLVEAVRDARGEDPGVLDKRLWVVSSEFSEIFKVLQRDGSTLSPKLRDAYDGKSLGVQTRKNPLHATDPHISVCGHVPQEELVRLLRNNPELTNGFANRFLVIWTYRYCELPDGGSPDTAAVAQIARRLKKAVQAATNMGQMSRDPEASKLWHEVYPQLNQELPGVRGAVLARGAAHCLRLSMLYALLDGSSVIRRVHLKAALAVWEYVGQSVAFIFGDAIGDKVTDGILRAIRQEPGLTRTGIFHALNRNVSAVEITDCLAKLLTWKMIREDTGQDDRGREVTIYCPTR